MDFSNLERMVRDSDELRAAIDLEMNRLFPVGKKVMVIINSRHECVSACISDRIPPYEYPACRRIVFDKPLRRGATQMIVHYKDIALIEDKQDER